MTKLSVNINKIATLRNARGGNNPNVLTVARDVELFGGQGITVHPRPDERHIRYQDVRDLRPQITTEFNIEGNPIDSFTQLVLEVVPTQVTLVPDGHDQITSNHGWDTLENKAFLTDICKTFKAAGIRTSIFVDADPRMVEGAGYAANREAAIAPFIAAAKTAQEVGLGLNAGHDLSLENLAYYHQQIPWTDEVSIGHALICDALYLGLQETIKQYLLALAH